MAAIRSTFAVDSGNRLGDRFYDVRWMSKAGTPPERRWFSVNEVLPEGHDPVWAEGCVDADGHLVVRYDHPDLVASGGPLPMWFVLIDFSNFTPPHFALLGYATDDMPAGTVVEAGEAGRLFDDNFLMGWTGLVKWHPQDLMLQQVTTADGWRRKGVASTMLLVCDVIIACYGLCPGNVLHGGAITTELGETLRTVFPGSPGRIDPRIGSVTVVQSD